MKGNQEIKNGLMELFMIDISEVESPRLLRLMGLAPPVDYQRLCDLLAARNPEVLNDGVSFHDMVLGQYGQKAVEFIEEFAIGRM